MTMNKVSFIDKLEKREKKRGPTMKNIELNTQARHQQLVRSLIKWKHIIMMPDEKIESSEVIRPFVILQPQYRIFKGDS